MKTNQLNPANEVNTKDMNFQLGVFLFNAEVDCEITGNQVQSYDPFVNFMKLIEALGLTEKVSDFKEGFLSECKYLDINKEKSEELFKEACGTVQFYLENDVSLVEA